MVHWVREESKTTEIKGKRGEGRSRRRAAASPRRRRIQRERTKKKAERGGRRSGEKEEGVRCFYIKGGGARLFCWN